MSPLTPEILKAFQHRAARVALTASSMRGSGSKGVIAAGRQFLGALDLKPFGTNQESRFCTALDAATVSLTCALPRKAQHWGLARKGLNIFLRECLYTVYLRHHYNLGASERWFELPLDSYTGKALCAEHAGLPPWRTVRGLDKALSEAFQNAATISGRQRGIDRVHLDAIWWGQRPTGGN